MDNVVTLVRIMKSIRELGYELFSRKPDAKIAGRLLHTVKDIMEQIRVIEDL